MTDWNVLEDSFNRSRNLRDVGASVVRRLHSLVEADHLFALHAKGADKWDIEHAQRTGREFVNCVTTSGVEFDGCELVTIPREDEEIWDGLEC